MTDFNTKLQELLGNSSVDKNIIQNVQILTNHLSKSNVPWLIGECHLGIRDEECISFEWLSRELYCYVFSDGIMIEKFTKFDRDTVEFSLSDLQDGKHILSYLSN